MIYPLPTTPVSLALLDQAVGLDLKAWEGCESSCQRPSGGGSRIHFTLHETERASISLLGSESPLHGPSLGALSAPTWPPPGGGAIYPGPVLLPYLKISLRAAGRGFSALHARGGQAVPDQSATCCGSCCTPARSPAGPGTLMTDSGRRQ